ncbi:antitoxin [Leptospira adleri]|uniref:antitoxin n=1 Tax=Leptospira adleri TaxID=2023186 RepID=UPI00108322E9|nr:antitoxin [Leptospira adleri]TGM52766.1 antitoxin [Leptospira adleri]
MKKEYDFSKSKKNPYIKKLKKPITIRVDVDTIGYFKDLSDQIGIPYQNLINLYLAECASKHKKIDLSWK